MGWCGNNHRILNENKTKETVDFRRTRIKPNCISIIREEVEVVQEYEYFSVHLNNRLDGRYNTDAVYRKGRSRLYTLRKKGPE